jgi:crotonobetainyl-CoA:carnitine CoA-transferase CaiB-like acyl-CoA transferase
VPDIATSPANRSYHCSPGEIAIDIQTEEQWYEFAVCLGRPELAYKGSWEIVRTTAPDGPTAHVLEEMFSEDTSHSWKKRLNAHGVRCVIVQA